MEGHGNRRKQAIFCHSVFRFIKVRNIYKMKKSCSPFPPANQQYQIQVSKQLAGQAVIHLAKGYKAPESDLFLTALGVLDDRGDKAEVNVHRVLFQN